MHFKVSPRRRYFRGKFLTEGQSGPLAGPYSYFGYLERDFSALLAWRKGKVKTRQEGSTCLYLPFPPRLGRVVPLPRPSSCRCVLVYLAWLACLQACLSLLSSILTKTVSSRPSMASISSHPWLAEQTAGQQQTWNLMWQWEIYKEIRARLISAELMEFNLKVHLYNQVIFMTNLVILRTNSSQN